MPDFFWVMIGFAVNIFAFFGGVALVVRQRKNAEKDQP